MGYKKLDPKFKAKWVKALRSGRYKQGKHRLRAHVSDGETGRYSDKVEYCCLGVAHNVATNGKGWAPIIGSSGKVVQYRTKQGGGSSYLSEDDPFFLPRSLQDMLAFKNDSGKWDFNRIADWIEKYL